MLEAWLLTELPAHKTEFGINMVSLYLCTIMNSLLNELTTETLTPPSFQKGTKLMGTEFSHAPLSSRYCLRSRELTLSLRIMVAIQVT